MTLVGSAHAMEHQAAKSLGAAHLNCPRATQERGTVQIESGLSHLWRKPKMRQVSKQHWMQEQIVSVHQAAQQANSRNLMSSVVREGRHA